MDVTGFDELPDEVVALRGGTHRAEEGEQGLLCTSHPDDTFEGRHGVPVWGSGRNQGVRRQEGEEPVVEASSPPHARRTSASNQDADPQHIAEGGSTQGGTRVGWGPSNLPGVLPCSTDPVLPPFFSPCSPERCRRRCMTTKTASPGRTGPGRGRRDRQRHEPLPGREVSRASAPPRALHRRPPALVPGHTWIADHEHGLHGAGRVHRWEELSPRLTPTGRADRTSTPSGRESAPGLSVGLNLGERMRLQAPNHGVDRAPANDVPMDRRHARSETRQTSGIMNRMWPSSTSSPHCPAPR